MDEEFDVDAALTVLLPWKLRLKLGGKWHETRSPSIAALGSLIAMKDRRDGEAHGMVIKIFHEMFVDPAAAMEKMNVPAMQLCMARILSYTGEYTSKNSQAVAAAIQRATAKPSPSGV